MEVGLSSHLDLNGRGESWNKLFIIIQCVKFVFFLTQNHHLDFPKHNGTAVLQKQLFLLGLIPANFANQHLFANLITHKNTLYMGMFMEEYPRTKT